MVEAQRRRASPDGDGDDCTSKVVKDPPLGQSCLLQGKGKKATAAAIAATAAAITAIAAIAAIAAIVAATKAS